MNEVELRSIATGDRVVRSQETLPREYNLVSGNIILITFRSTIFPISTLVHPRFSIINRARYSFDGSPYALPDISFVVRLNNS